MKFTLHTSTYDAEGGWKSSITPDEMKFVAQLEAMVDNAVQVSLNTIRLKCAGINEWAKGLGYAVGSGERGLHLKKDWHVRYYRSTFNGKTCYYIDWSGHQFIWL